MERHFLSKYLSYPRILAKPFLQTHSYNLTVSTQSSASSSHSWFPFRHSFSGGQAKKFHCAAPPLPWMRFAFFRRELDAPAAALHLPPPEWAAPSVQSPPPLSPSSEHHPQLIPPSDRHRRHVSKDELRGTVHSSSSMITSSDRLYHFGLLYGRKVRDVIFGCLGMRLSLFNHICKYKVLRGKFRKQVKCKIDS